MNPQDNKYEVSAPALHAARTVLKNFDITETKGGRIRATEKNLAIIIDVCTGIFRVERAMDNMLNNLPWHNKEDLASNMDMLRDAIRAVDMVRKHIPSYGGRGNSNVLRDLGSREPPRRDTKYIQQVSNALRTAKTPDEEQKVLRAAGII